MHYQLADLFEALCDANPDALCLIAGDKRYSRRELDHKANRLAHYWVTSGIQPGDRIGVYAYNRGEWIEVLLACWKIRAVAVNINYRYVGDELRYLWDNAELSALVYEKKFTPQVVTLATDFPGIRQYLVLDDDSKLDRQHEDYERALSSCSKDRHFPEPYSERSDDDIFMMYTGGTTGMPKGVLWRHDDWYHNVVCMNQPTDTPQHILQYANLPNALRSMVLSPLMHGGGQYAVVMTILRGGVVAIPVSTSLNPQEILETIQRENIMLLSLIGDAMARPIAEYKLKSGIQTPSLSIISSGGALLSDEARRLLKQAFGENLYLTGGIGGSEMGSAAVESGTNRHGHTTFKANPLAAVLNDNLEKVMPGDPETGWLAMQGFIPLGYYNDPKKTAEVFKTDAHGVRWVLAGDRARVEPDGSFTLVGRDSQCINSGGEKIYVEEVEKAILSHPAVRYCLVIGRPDPKWQQKVCAIVELAEGQSLSLQALQQHCRERIAGYKIPRALLIAAIERLPNGKPNYRWAQEYMSSVDESAIDESTVEKNR